MRRAEYVCTLRYPSRFDDPEAMGYYSEQQLAYLYDYFADRVVPCLRMLGYPVSDPPDRQGFVEGFYDDGFWVPYYDAGIPDELSWNEVQLRCPLPSFAAVLKPVVNAR